MSNYVKLCLGQTNGMRQFAYLFNRRRVTAAVAGIGCAVGVGVVYNTGELHRTYGAQVQDVVVVDCVIDVVELNITSRLLHLRQVLHDEQTQNDTNDSQQISFLASGYD